MMSDETFTEVDAQRARFQADLAQSLAKIRSEQDRARQMFHTAFAQALATTHGEIRNLLASAVFYESMIFGFMDYGTRGFIVTSPKENVKNLQFTLAEITQMNEELLRSYIVNWAVAGAAPPRHFFWHK